jgi:hypothetical protein
LANPGHAVQAFLVGLADVLHLIFQGSRVTGEPALLWVMGEVNDPEMLYQFLGALEVLGEG